MANFESLLSRVQSAEIAVLDRKKEVIIAQRELLLWEQQDHDREDGSPAQDARHEEFGRRKKNKLLDAENKLKDAENQLEDAKSKLRNRDKD